MKIILLLGFLLFSIIFQQTHAQVTPSKVIYGITGLSDDDINEIQHLNTPNHIWEHDGDCGMEEDEIEHARYHNFLHPSGHKLDRKSFIKNTSNRTLTHHLSKTHLSTIFRDEDGEDDTQAQNLFPMSILGTNKPMPIPSKPKKTEVEVPKCGITICCNPEIRKQYDLPSYRPKYKVFIDWLYIKSDENWRDAEETVKRMTEDLNQYYGPTNLNFVSNILFFDLNDELADKIGVSDPETLQGMRVHKYDCALREDALNTQGTHCVAANDLMLALRGEDWQKKKAFQLIPVTFTRLTLNGFGKFPWASDHGMIVVSHQALKPGTTTLPHEMGHCFGLLHTFTGYSKDQCQQCTEKNAEGDELTGDLIPGTPAMPLWHALKELGECENQNPDVNPVCFEKWSENVPKFNMMSYGTCRREFHFDQISRIHCYMDKIITKNIFWERV